MPPGGEDPLTAKVDKEGQDVCGQMNPNLRMEKQFLGSTHSNGVDNEALVTMFLSSEAAAQLAGADKHIPGFGEVFRTISLKTVGTSSIQSRACAVLANGKYIFALPGSSGGVTDAWDQILIHQLDINHKPCNFVELFPRLKEK